MRPATSVRLTALTAAGHDDQQPQRAVYSDSRDAPQCDPQIAAFLEGLELIEPGIVSCPRWRPEPHDIGSTRDMDEFCALGRK